MKPKRYTLLHGCKKNIGDFIIYDRAKKLLKHIKPEYTYLELEGWKRLDKYIDEINKTRALIICGGPGLQPKMYPNVYPLVENLDEIKVPIYTLGSGWKGFPGDSQTIYNYKFSSESRKLLDKVEMFGVRDYYTERALKNNGYNNVSMNGCPVWYNIDSLGKKFKPPKNIQKIVFTPSQENNFHKQSIRIMAIIKKLFPNAEIICSFHRGISSDDFTSNREARNIKMIIKEAKELNIKVSDTSYQLNKINFYNDCDIHIGYRLHAHILFLSKRKPSFLLHEDGRGNGLSETIGLPGINAWQRKCISSISGISLAKYLLVRENPYAIKELENYIKEELKYDFNRFSGIDERIDRQFEIMKQFICNILP